MIKEKKLYTITCDRCGIDADEIDVYSEEFETEQEAIEYSKEIGWIETNGNHYCQDCKDEIV